MFCPPQESETGDQRVREVLIASLVHMFREIFVILSNSFEMKKKSRNHVGVHVGVQKSHKVQSSFLEKKVPVPLRLSGSLIYKSAGQSLWRKQ